MPSISYSIKNTEVKLIEENRDQFQYDFILKGNYNDEVKYNYNKVYSVPTSFRARIKKMESRLISSLRDLAREFESVDEVKKLTRTLLDKEIEEIKLKKDSNYNFIVLQVLVLYSDNFEIFFERKIKNKFRHLLSEQSI